MNKEQFSAIGAPLVHVTGVDGKGDVYFRAAQNKIGVLRKTRRGYCILAGFRGRTEGYWLRKGTDYLHRRYPVYEICIACKYPTKEAVRQAITGF